MKEVDTLAVCPLQPLSPPSWTKPEETNSLLLGRPMLVVGTGALYDGRGLAANPGWDAQAVWVGTRFVAYEEVGAPPMYKKAIMDTGHEDFVRTLIYTRRPLRVIRSPNMTSRSTPKNPTVSKPRLTGRVATQIHEVLPTGKIVDDTANDAARISEHDASLVNPKAKL